MQDGVRRRAPPQNDEAGCHFFCEAPPELPHRAGAPQAQRTLDHAGHKVREQLPERLLVYACGSVNLAATMQVGPVAWSGVADALLAQDAFTLSNLKVEAKLVADQRDAINRRIDAYSAPESLARSAAALGMKPSETPIFLNLAATGEVKNG